VSAFGGAQKPKRYSFATATGTDLATGINGMPRLWSAAEYVSHVDLAADTAPTGHTLDVAISYEDPNETNSVALGTFSIAIAANSSRGTLTPTLIPDGKMVKVSVSAIGSTVPGQGLSVAIY
jgi:hypothetical protein